MADLSEDFDFSITLHEYGWMTCNWHRKDRIYKEIVSDVLGDPLHDLMQMLLALLNNEDRYTIKWFNEPGWTFLTVSRNMKQRNLIKITMGPIPEESDPKKITLTEVETEITQYRFIVVFYQQLKKIKLLLKERHYAKNRIHAFPLETFQRLSDKLAASLPEVC